MSDQLVSKNKKAFHQYEILDRFEAGIVLEGTEVKAIREHKVNLKDSYARIKDGEAWLENCHISPYSHGNISNHDPLRPRKLLLHRREIKKLLGKTLKSGFTIVPLSVYLKNGKVKVEIALARGKRLHDKREAARRKAVDREVEVELKRRRP
ncbi:SsrA-binding protein SmpB [Acidobacteria bacterium AH-259-D05]|nr:SsrA-binding protein SmpB [Acidobacteria bacterium AH-259-D05]